MEASIFWCSAFFMVQLSHPYITIGKTITLTVRDLVGEVMSLLFYMLSRFVIAFLPRNKCLLISWLQSQSPSTVILEPKKIKSVTVSVISPCHFSSVQFSRSVMSNSLQPHESQHTRPPCPSPTPGVHSDSCPSSR